MDHRVAEIADWFMAQIGAPIVIRKEEQGDVDQVSMTVQKVSFLTGSPDRDDYVEENRLVLLGDGKIATEGDGGAAELPRHSYEIPLGPSFRSAIDERELQVSTDRAFYRVVPQGPPQ
ncbi:hypothetical protein FE782_19290 [Paenibacillus antri]|uniref:Uncharacterized protein n=1 Tax=Paenibacillus antri TaxID=2582848 RepID=A0A5R9G422_9BACL|nr:hypothetical protein [Paenibacillus antri]TLS50511.1 hypothetical protein FE782_19290 [Paenibacillus antri]